MYIDEGNQRSGRDDLGAALTSGRAFSVVPRNGLVVIDADADALGPWYSAALNGATAIGCAIVRVGSGRPGHEHAWIVGPVGWDSQDIAAELERFGAPRRQLRFGDGGRIRPPCSPHRLSGAGHLIDPRDQKEALVRLTGRPNAVPLDPRFDQLIKWGDVEHRYWRDGTPMRSRAVLAAAFAYVNAGNELSDLQEALASSSSELGMKYRERDDRWLAEIWANARSVVRANPPRGQGIKDHQLDLIANAIDLYPWKGRTGTTDRRVFEAMFGIAQNIRSLQVEVSYRRLGELAGVEAKTAVNAVTRLLGSTGAPMIVRIPGWSTSQSGCYSLAPAVELGRSTSNDHTNSIAPLEGNSVVITDVVQPPAGFLGEPGGLPRGAWETYRAMPERQWLATAQVVERRPGEASASTVRGHLWALLSAGFVDCRNCGRRNLWQALPAPDLVRLTTYLGVPDKRARLHDRHVLERALYRDWKQAADDSGGTCMPPLPRSPHDDDWTASNNGT
jgi:hypothetical protein